MTPRLITKRAAEDYAGGENAFKRIVKSTDLKPFLARHRNALYDRHAIDAAIDEITLRGWDDE